MRLSLMLIAAATLSAADPAVIEKGRAEEKRQCVACHGLRIIHVQRLSRAGWGRELDKMANWGAAIADRDSLMEYLVANFGNDKPLPTPPLSKDSSGRK